MSKPKRPRLTTVPRRAKRKPPTSAAPVNGDGTAAAPDLSMIAEALRPLAVPIGTLLFDPANAVTHSEANLDGIKGSLAVYGQRRPVVYRRDNGVVIAGNGVLASALSLGWNYLAALAVDDDAATAAGFSIADNRTSDLHQWDKDALDKLLRECSTANDERLDRMMADLGKQQGIVPGEEKASGDEDEPQEYQAQYGVIVICRDEAHQQEVYEKLGADGLEVKVVVT